MKGLILGVLILFSTAAHADELTYVPSIAVGFNTLDFETASATNDLANFKLVDLGYAVAGKRWYAKFNAEIPFDDSYNLPQNRVYKREDYNLVAGYFVTPRISTFIGYTYGNTSINRIGTTLIGHLDVGPFIGVGTGIPMGDKSSLAMSLAYASLNGEREIGAGGSRDYGTTTGYSAAVTWNRTLRNDRDFYVALRYRNYQSDLSGGTIRIAKTFTTLTFGTQFPF